MLIKTVLIYGSVVLVSLGTILLSGFGGMISFIVMAASLLNLHFLGLFFGGRVVGSSRMANIQHNRMLRFVLVLIFANVFFIVGLAAMLSFAGEIYGSVALSTMMAATNLIPVLLVAAAGGLAKRLA